MKSFFTANFFAGNRSRLLNAIKDDVPLFIIGNGTLQRNRDNTYPFRQNSNFWYLTGLDEPELVLMVYRGKSTIIVPDRDAVHSYFEGELQPDRIKKTAGVDQVLYMREAWPLIRAVLLANNKIAINDPDPEYDSLHRIYTNPAQKRFVRKIKRVNPKLKLIDVRKQLMDLRWIKQKPELQAIQQAIDITCKTFSYIQDNINSYNHEYEIEAELSRQYVLQQSKHAYGAIVGAGINSCTLHYQRNNQPFSDGQVLLVDSGAEYQNYAADITRTFVKGRPSKLQTSIVMAVSEAWDTCVAQLKPGATFYDALMDLERSVGEQLVKLGFITSATDREQIQKYYPHASHFLGLDVHDVGDYRKPLEPGVVLTVEPGIYIAEKAVGVRIEDDIVITENGCEVLSKQLPKHFIVD